MYCTNCGFDNQAEMRFCGMCGYVLEHAEFAIKRCKKCRFPNPPANRFCGGCGSDLALDTDTFTLGVQPGYDTGVLNSLPAEAPVTEPIVAKDERKIVTVLFGDISGFTAFSEQLDPEEVKQLMNTCLRRLATEVKRYGGVVDKFAGDSIMAVFGAPAAHEDDPERAIRAALAMQSALSDLSNVLQRRYNRELRLRIGINTGQVLAGIVGSSRANDYTVMGDTVNTAARIQTAAREGYILVGEATYAATKEIFSYREMQPVQAKGKQQPVSVWEVESVRHQRGSVRGIAGLRGRMVGRGREIVQLKQTIQNVVRERRTYTVTVFGSAGMGKSRLAADFQRYLEEIPDYIYTRKGRCLPFGSDTGYHALVDIVNSICEILDSDPPHEARAKLYDTIRSMIVETETGALGNDLVMQIAERVGQMINLPFPDSSLAAIDPSNLRSELFWGMRKFLLACAARHPLVLVFEDIQWADNGLVEFITYLAQASTSVPLLILALARPELLERVPRWAKDLPRHISIELQPLTGAQGREMVEAMLKYELLPDHVKQLILEKADGNPFFIEERLRILIDDGIIARESHDLNSPWVLVRPAADIALPTTIQTLIAARADRLPPDEKYILQQAAVVALDDRIFWSGAVRHLTGNDPRTVNEALESLSAKGLIASHEHSAFAGEQEFAFSQALIREVAYETIPKGDRSRQHRAVAAWIEIMAGERRDQFCDLLAQQYERAYRLFQDGMNLASQDNEMEREAESMRSAAFHYLCLAAERTRGAQANRLAARFYQQALNLLESNEIVISLHYNYADVLIALSQYDEAAKLLESVCTRSQQTGDQVTEAAALQLLANIYRYKGDPDRAKPLVERALAICEQTGDLKVHAKALHVLGGIAADSGATQEGVENLVAASALFRQIDDQPGAARCLVNLAGTAMQRDDLSGALTYARQALEIYEHLGDRRGMALTSRTIGSINYFRGDLEHAEYQLRLALQRFRELGFLRAETYTLSDLARVLAARGTPSEAKEEAERSLLLARQIGDRKGESMTLRRIAMICLDINAVAEAERFLNDALKLSQASNDTSELPEIYRGLAEVCLLKNDSVKAGEFIEQARAIVKPNDAFSQATTLRTLGRAYRMQGYLDRAYHACRQSVTVLETSGYHIELPSSCYELAQVCADLERDDEAAFYWDRAHKLLQSSGSTRALPSLKSKVQSLKS